VPVTPLKLAKTITKQHAGMSPRSSTASPTLVQGVLDRDRRELERFITRGIDAEKHRAIGDLPRGRGILGVLIDEPHPLRIPDVGTHAKSYGFPPAHPRCTASSVFPSSCAARSGATSI